MEEPNIPSKEEGEELVRTGNEQGADQHPIPAEHVDPAQSPQDDDDSDPVDPAAGATSDPHVTEIADPPALSDFAPVLPDPLETRGTDHAAEVADSASSEASQEDPAEGATSDTHDTEVAKSPPQVDGDSSAEPAQSPQGDGEPPVGPAQSPQDEGEPVTPVDATASPGAAEKPAKGPDGAPHIAEVAGSKKTGEYAVDPQGAPPKTPHSAEAAVPTQSEASQEDPAKSAEIDPMGTVPTPSPLPQEQQTQQPAALDEPPLVPGITGMPGESGTEKDTDELDEEPVIDTDGDTPAKKPADATKPDDITDATPSDTAGGDDMGIAASIDEIKKKLDEIDRKIDDLPSRITLG